MWEALFHTPLQDYDVLLLLRTEALPHASRALQPLGVGPQPLGDEPAAKAKALKRRAGQPDALSGLLEGGKPDPPPKRARAFLSAFSDEVRGTDCGSLWDTPS